MRVRLVILVLAAGLALGPQVHAATSVNGDDYRDQFVGTGGLILPSSVGEDTRRRVAGCADCTWRLTDPCVVDGNAFDGSAVCDSVARGCPQARRTLRSWFSSGAGRWEDLGVVCISEPVTVHDVGVRVRDRLAQAVPPLDISFQPREGVLSQLPVIVDSGQAPGRVSFDMEVAGQSVSVIAGARWHWDFGDGYEVRTTSPGCAWPCTDITHAYRSPGEFYLAAKSTWQGDFRVDGLGPFPIQDPVTQQARDVVRVRQGRALLTPSAYGTMTEFRPVCPPHRTCGG